MKNTFVVTEKLLVDTMDFLRDFGIVRKKANELTIISELSKAKTEGEFIRIRNKYRDMAFKKTW